MKDNEFLRGKIRDAKGEQLLSLLMKAITLTAIFIGIWASTQRFASITGHDPGWVGQPFFTLELRGNSHPLYYPWMIFYWMLMYIRRTEIHPFLHQASMIMKWTSFSAIVFYFLVEFIIIKNISQKVFGTARWGTDKDLKKAGLLGTSGGMVLGQTAKAEVFADYDSKKNAMVLHSKKPSQKIVQAGIYNTALSAPTRSGKGVSSGIPTCLSYPGSLIVLDFKGENFNLTSGFRAKFGKVYRWAPTGDTGHHFNPMAEIRSGENAFSDANLIADILTTPASGGGNATSEHFQTGAKDFLTALILHCLCSDWEHKSLPGCRKFLAQRDPNDPDNKKYIYDLMIDANHGDDSIHQSIVEGATAQRNRPDDEGGSMLSTVNNALAVFADPKIERNTWNSEFYIDEFEETKRPISLYLTIQYSDVQRIAPLIRMFILMFSRRFTGGETMATNRKFEIPLLFILDEFDKLGKMEELHMNMGIHNGFGIHYFLIFQSLNQLNAIYGKDHSFLAHCRNTIIYAPGAGELESAEMISKICGKESVTRTNISYSDGRAQVGYSNKNISSQDQERSLINADEVIKLPLDQFILICQGMPPYIGKKNVYYEDPLFKARLLPPAFSTREQAVRMAASTIAKLNKRRWYIRAEEMLPEMGDSEALDMWEKLEGLLDDMPDENMAAQSGWQNEDKADSGGGQQEDVPVNHKDTVNFL